MADTVETLIARLREVDSRRFSTRFPKGWRERSGHAEPLLAELVQMGGAAVEPLIGVVGGGGWAAAFAARALGDIGDERAVPPLVDALSCDGDYLFNEALFALKKLGRMASGRLIAHLREAFADGQPAEGTRWHGHLEALCGTRTEEAVSFAISLRGKIPSESLGFYCSCLGGTLSPEALPALDEMRRLHRRDREVQMEAGEAISAIRNGKDADLPGDARGLRGIGLLRRGVELEEGGRLREAETCYVHLLAQEHGSYHAQFCLARICRRLGKPQLFRINEALETAAARGAGKDVLGMMREEKERTVAALREQGLYDEGDEETWLEFRCRACGAEQFLRTGQIIIAKRGRRTDCYFRCEVMCSQCLSHDLELTRRGMMEVVGESMRTSLSGTDRVIRAGSAVVAGREVRMDRVGKVAEELARKHPRDARLLLRAANSLRAVNRHDEAIRCYLRSTELNPRLLANHINLIGVYLHRHIDFGIEGAREAALEHLARARSLLSSGGYDAETLQKDANSAGEFGAYLDHAQKELERPRGAAQQARGACAGPALPWRGLRGRRWFSRDDNHQR